MKIVVFVGPTLAVDDARAILDATYLPPAAQTDLLSVTVDHAPDVIGLIDGVFLHSLSVWHKEVLFALQRGVLVYGASSMGALRAAETSAFGMRGVGEIYRMYEQGELVDDDEVALAHASSDQGYRKLSEPMVNIRATLDAAEAAGIVDRAEHDAVIAAAKAIYFPDRTFAAVLAAAADRGVPAPALERLARFNETGYVDLKRRDAVLLLETIRGVTEEDVAAARAAAPPFDFVESTNFDTLYARDRWVRQGAVRLPLESIANHAALHHPNFDDLNLHALNRTLTVALAKLLDLTVDDEDVEREALRFRRRHALLDDAALSAWLGANHLEAAEFRDLVRELALCRRMHRWLVIATWMPRTTKTLLDELRLRDQYVEWAERAAAHERLVSSSADGDDAVAARMPLEDLLDEHAMWTERPLDTEPERWLEEAGFHSEGTLRMELGRARAARRALLRLVGAPTSA